MCKSKMSVAATQPISSTPRRTHQSTQTPTTVTTSTTTPATTTDTSKNHYTSSSSSSYKLSSTASTSSSSTSLSTLKDSLPVPENPILYTFSELSAATNNFLSPRLSSSTPSWRCTLRGKDAVVFQRKFRFKLSTPSLTHRLSTLCRSHHTSIVRLLGAHVSSDHTFLVYDFVPGASLASCLRNPNNPNFTPLSTWTSRIQIATDLAQGLDYIHNNNGLNVNLVHNHIKSGAVLVTEPNFNARICHFGAAQLCGETDSFTHVDPNYNSPDADETAGPTGELRRSDSRRNQFVGARGYMSPEFQTTGVATQKSDVYGFGVVLLEILSGKEPFKYKFDKNRGDFIRTSVVESAEAAVRYGAVRTWVDSRLKDSFPVEVADKLTRVALECVHVDPDRRPSMERVSGKISKLYLESRFWSDNMRVPAGISVSLGPR